MAGKFGKLDLKALSCPALSLSVSQCRRNFRVEIDNSDTFDTSSCKLLFIVHCYVIVANAVSGCYFPLVLCNTRVKHMAFGMFHGRSLHVVITLLAVYSQEYRIELKLFVVYLIIRNYDSAFATFGAGTRISS